ncbi:MAG: hypothetical protein JWR21_58 [Herminiimonas sp.]|nr:hypothetical protein [Herminiimonas sp.]
MTDQVPLRAFRIALLVDSVTVSQPVNVLVDWLETQPSIDLCALVIHPPPQSAPKGFGKLLFLARQQGWYTAISRAAFAALVFVEQTFLKRKPFYQSRLDSFDIGDRVLKHVQTQPITENLGSLYDFSAPDLDAIRALDVDLLIRCGSSILKGGILSVAKHGVLSMHHGDNRINRGGPAAFWEVLLRQPYTGFIIQRLTEELDGGQVLYRGSITTKPCYVANLVSLYERSYPYLFHTIRQVMAGTTVVERSTIYFHGLYRTPLLHETVEYVIKTARMLVGEALRKLCGKSWVWGVGYTFGDWHNAVLWRGRVIKNPTGRYLADPFAMEHEGSHYVVLEDYDHAKSKGTISAYKVNKSGAFPLGVVLEENFHLSFPFLFRHGGEIYMVPESSDNRDIRAYRAVDFPRKWELAAVLMSGVQAVDTTIFQSGGRWWMLTTINPTGHGANDAELHVFSSDSPLDGWKPHNANPVIMDASRGRSGGLLFKGGEIYRVAQRHGFQQYGIGSSVYRIAEINEKRYIEEHVQDIDPKFFKGAKGTHHLHHNAGLTVFDYLHDARP